MVTPGPTNAEARAPPRPEEGRVSSARGMTCARTWRRRRFEEGATPDGAQARGAGHEEPVAVIGSAPAIALPGSRRAAGGPEDGRRASGNGIAGGEAPSNGDGIEAPRACRGRRPEVRGKFLYVGGEKLWIRGVTYGTFKPAPV